MKKKAFGFTLIELLVCLAIIVIFASVLFGGCRGFVGAEDDATRILENEGYSQIKLDRTFFGGREDAVYSYKFSGYNRMTNYVEGIVTGDSWSGWSIRIH